MKTGWNDQFSRFEGRSRMYRETVLDENYAFARIDLECLCVYLCRLLIDPLHLQFPFVRIRIILRQVSETVSHVGQGASQILRQPGHVYGDDERRTRVFELATKFGEALDEVFLRYLRR